MLEVNREKLDVRQKTPVVSEKAESKQDAVSSSAVSSYDDSNANLAITNSAQASISKKFKPATTQEELVRQINNTKWLNHKLRIDPKLMHCFSDKEIKVFSEFWHRLDNLSPILQRKIDPAQLLEAHFSSGHELYKYHSSVEYFNPANVNRLDVGIQKAIGDDFSSCIPIDQVDDAEVVNELYHTLNDDYKNEVFRDYKNCIKSKEKTEDMIAKTEFLNSLNPAIVKIAGAANVIDNPLDIKHLKIQTEYLNNLSQKQISKLSKSYLRDIFKKSYSYAIDNIDYEPVCGTKEFKPFVKKSQLKSELASMRNKDNEWMFCDKDINDILQSENDISELSKILHAVQFDKIELSPSVIKTLLTKEGATYRDVQPGLDFVKGIQQNKKFSPVKSYILNNPDVFELTKDEIENIKNNSELIGVLKTYNPKDFKKVVREDDNTILDILKSSKIEPASLKEFLEKDIYSTKASIKDLNVLLCDENFTEFKPQNIKFLNDLKLNPLTQFLFDGSDFALSNSDISHILNMELPEDFDLKNQKDMLELMNYIKSNQETSNKIKIKNLTYAMLLAKQESFEDGKKVVDFLIENKIDNTNINKILVKNTFKVNLDLLNQIKRISCLSGKYCLDQNIGSIAKYSDKEVQSAIDILEYPDSTGEFDGCAVILDSIIRSMKARKEKGAPPLDSLQISQNIDNLIKVKKKMSPKLWNSVSNKALYLALTESKINQIDYKDENIDYFNKLFADERLKDKQKYLACYMKAPFLELDLDIDALYANYEDKFKFLEKYADEVSLANLIMYPGDIKKLESIYEKLKEENVDCKCSLYINPVNHIAVISKGNIVYMYDKNMDLITTYKETKHPSTTEDSIYVREYKSDKVNISNVINYRFDGDYHPLHIVSSYYDDNGNVQKTRIYDESTVDGLYNIKELYSDGKIKTLATAHQTSEGQFIKKNFESLDGTKTKVLYRSDSKGNDNYTYNIVDKDGKCLLDLTRTTEVIDENTKVTTVNDKKYEIKYSDDIIAVNDLNNKSKTILNMSDINPNNDSVIKDVLKALSGDELLSLKKCVNKIELNDKILSEISHDNNVMSVGPNKFIFEHELGHGKDLSQYDFDSAESKDKAHGLICSDTKLQEIFESEKRSLKANLPYEITNEVDYFINDETHYRGKYGGLGEVIAEVNAIQSTPVPALSSMPRAQILQEYFPRTIAYLVNNHL